MEVNHLTNLIIRSAIAVHSHLGPGLLESTYEACLAYELRMNGLKFALQKPINVLYRETNIDICYKADLVVEDRVLVELKSVGELNRVHEAQVLTYMKLANLQIGLLINFNVSLLKYGIKRFII